MSYIVADCVHSDLSLPGYVKEIIATKEFQRLKQLKQLGVSHFVFKGAIHCRAQHCIGTAFLCSQLLNILERNSDQKIDELHKKCVILAGLLHDIGHGPYSHLWEGVVHQGTDKTWTHEQQSKKMIEHLITANDIKLHESPELHKFALRLITSLITADCEVWLELLEPQEMFLTEIVSNKFCNIDVDKCDYILRDNHHVKQFVVLKPLVGLFERARIVFDLKGTSHIGYHVDDYSLIENLFYNRAYLHMNVYQCHQVAGAERMVKDICGKGDAGGVTINNLPLTEVHQDGNAFLKLDDSVLDLIKQSKLNNESLRNAQNLLNDLNSGRLYTMVFESHDNDCARECVDMLVKKFGSIFCTVEKAIPCAEVPSNIPLYNDDELLIKKTSSLQLSFRSLMIYCTTSDETILNNVKNFIDSIKNNNI